MRVIIDQNNVAKVKTVWDQGLRCEKTILTNASEKKCYAKSQPGPQMIPLDIIRVDKSHKSVGECDCEGDKCGQLSLAGFLWHHRQKIADLPPPGLGHFQHVVLDLGDSMPQHLKK